MKFLNIRIISVGSDDKNPMIAIDSDKFTSSWMRSGFGLQCEENIDHNSTEELCKELSKLVDNYIRKTK